MPTQPPSAHLHCDRGSQAQVPLEQAPCLNVAKNETETGSVDMDIPPRRLFRETDCLTEPNSSVKHISALVPSARELV